MGIWGQALEEHVDEQMAVSPVYASTICRYLRQLRNGYWEQWYVNAIFQQWAGRPRPSIYDAHCFSQVHSMLMCGDILTATVDMHEEPYPDCRIEDNDEALSKMSPIFYGRFWGGKSESDGYFGWKKPLVMGQQTPEGIFRDIIDARRVPLEVGYTRAEITIKHLAEARGLARWPYGSKFIHLLVLVNDEFYRVSFDCLEA